MIVMQTDIPGIRRVGRGKVRDIYDLGTMLLIVVTDRLSAFDVVMSEGIPDKGKVLNLMAAYWFERTDHIVRNHLVTTDIDTVMSEIERAGGPNDATTRAQLEGRSMLVFKAKPFPVECIVRGYLAGSLWKEYKQAGGCERPVTLHGIDLPAGLRESDRLDTPIFTPSTKATEGHDINISLDEAVKLIGDAALELRDASIRLYSFAREEAAKAGIIIADTKFEFGEFDGELMLIDEALTPDSSRFWPGDAYQPGGAQPSFDKQYVRDWLEATGWDKTPPPPHLPDEVVEQTAQRYRDAYRYITGNALPS